MLIVCWRLGDVRLTGGHREELEGVRLGGLESLVGLESLGGLENIVGLESLERVERLDNLESLESLERVGLERLGIERLIGKTN